MPRTAHACAKEGKTTGKGFGFADNIFCNEHKVEMKRIKKKKLKTSKKEIEGKMQGYGRGRNKDIGTCSLELCLSPAKTANNNQKTKAVGFLSNSVFLSPKKETTLKGLEEFRKHFRAIRLQDINGHTG